MKENTYHVVNNHKLTNYAHLDENKSKIRTRKQNNAVSQLFYMVSLEQILPEFTTQNESTSVLCNFGPLK